MYMIEITDDKVQHLAEKTGKALRYMGEVMSCIDEMQNGDMGERGGYGRYGSRDGYYGGRGGWDDDMGERRGVPGSGRRY